MGKSWGGGISKAGADPLGGGCLGMIALNGMVSLARFLFRL